MIIKYDLMSKAISKVLEKNTIAIYGAGRTTEHIVCRINNEMKKNIVGLIDRAVEKQNSKISGIKIHSLDKIKELDPAYIIVSVEHYIVAKEIVKLLSNRSYKNIKILNLHDLYFQEVNLLNGYTIVLYTMGKVGSKTIKKSLRNFFDLYDVHYMTELGLESETTRNYHFKGFKPNGEAQFLNQYIDDQKKNWKIITLIREPVSQSIAWFFQNINTHYKDFNSRYKDGKITIEDLLCKYFDVEATKSPFESFDSWFDLEMKKVFGIDVFANEFSVEKGYKIYKHNNVELLLLRLENLNQNAPEAFQQFLGLKYFDLQLENLASQKEYYNAYLKFRECIVFCDKKLDKIYDSRFVKHFYSDVEIKQFLKMWNIKK
ncbi:putative capsular polysaccharide synthesis family protein [Cytobacillus sp. Hm23]